MNTAQTIDPQFRARVIAAFDYFNPYRLLDGERCNSWVQLRAHYQRDLERHAENTRKGFLHWLIAEADEAHYCRIHDC